MCGCRHSRRRGFRPLPFLWTPCFAALRLVSRLRALLLRPPWPASSGRARAPWPLSSPPRPPYRFVNCCSVFVLRSAAPKYPSAAWPCEVRPRPESLPVLFSWARHPSWSWGAIRQVSFPFWRKFSEVASAPFKHYNHSNCCTIATVSHKFAGFLGIWESRPCVNANPEAQSPLQGLCKQSRKRDVKKSTFTLALVWVLPRKQLRPIALSSKQRCFFPYIRPDWQNNMWFTNESVKRPPVGQVKIWNRRRFRHRQQGTFDAE